MAISVVVVVVVLVALAGVLLGVSLKYRQRKKNMKTTHDIMEMSTIDLTRYCTGQSGCNAAVIQSIALLELL